MLQHPLYPLFPKPTQCITQMPTEQVSIPSYAMITEVPSVPFPFDDAPLPEKVESTTIHLTAKKKYKPVALKTKPVLADLPEKYRIVRNIKGDPLATLPVLTPNPPKFEPYGRYTQERKELFEVNNCGFLFPAEMDLLHHFMILHQDGFAWTDNERGHFREDFFPPVEMPVIPHKPWVLRNHPIPPGIHGKVCDTMSSKVQAGVFETSSSPYRSKVHYVPKKNGIDIRIVQCLEPLNKVTIQHSGVPPFTEQLAEHFAG